MFIGREILLSRQNCVWRELIPNTPHFVSRLSNWIELNCTVCLLVRAEPFDEFEIS